MGKKVPVWVLLLVIFIALNLTVLFGWIVNYASEGKKGLGKFGPIVITVAKFPTLVKRALIEVSGRSPLLIDNRFPEIDGFKKNGYLQKGAVKDNGFVLLSSYDKNKKQSTVKLIRIKDQQVIHEWAPDVRKLAEMANNLNIKNAHFDINNMKPSRLRMLHPLLLDDGGVVFDSFNGPIFKLDACSNIEWSVNGVFHHSKELDADGNIWVPEVSETTSVDKKSLEYNKDSIVKISLSGKVLYRKSVSEILLENGYRGILLGVGIYDSDVLHLNDIQPALYSTKYWRKGDLLVSLRHRSTVFLFRPSTNKVIWLKTGPWLNQHDANFVGQSQISIFGNDVVRVNGIDSDGETIFPEGHNEAYLYDFTDGSISTPFSKVLKAIDVRTSSEGRLAFLGNGDVFIEESNYGRILRLSPKQPLWEFTVKFDDHTNSLLSWSSYLTERQIRNILPILKKPKCP